MKAGYKDKNGLEIELFDVVQLSCNPHHGRYTVEFGEYTLENFMKTDRQNIHKGWYLTDGKEIVSLAYAMSQPTDYGSSKHSVEIIDVN